MVYWNDTMVDYHQWRIYMVHPEESHFREQIINSKYDKPYINEVYKNQSNPFQCQSENLKEVIIIYKAVMKGTLGRFTGQPVNIHFKP